MSLSIYHTHTLIHWGAWVREEKLSQVRERKGCWRSSLCFWVLLLPLVFILSPRKLQGFLLYGFPEKFFFCFLSLVIIVVHGILSDKILRSYCLNDTNLTCRIWGSSVVTASEVEYHPPSTFCTLCIETFYTGMTGSIFCYWSSMYTSQVTRYQDPLSWTLLKSSSCTNLWA